MPGFCRDHLKPIGDSTKKIRNQITFWSTNWREWRETRHTCIIHSIQSEICFCFQLLSPLGHFVLVNLTVLYREEVATTGPISRPTFWSIEKGQPKPPACHEQHQAKLISLVPIQHSFSTGHGCCRVVWFGVFFQWQRWSFCSLLLNFKLMRSIFLKHSKLMD